MKKGLTELVMILDRSGSMAGLEADTIGGFNGMIEKQKKEPGEAYVSTVIFASQSRMFHDRVPIGRVEPLTDRQYAVGGCTALLDAVGSTIRHIGEIHRYARPEDVPAHTLFVITTDGMENASREFSAETIRRMIEQKKEERGWEFVFLGANIDAVSTAARIGIGKDRAVNYCNDGAGVEENFKAIEKLSCSVRSTGRIDEACIRKLQERFKTQGKR